MSLEKRTPLDRKAYQLLHNQKAAAPAGLWTKVSTELDALEPKRRLKPIWLLGATLLVGAGAGAFYNLSEANDDSLTARLAPSGRQEVELVSENALPGSGNLPAYAIALPSDYKLSASDINAANSDAVPELLVQPVTKFSHEQLDNNYSAQGKTDITPPAASTPTKPINTNTSTSTDQQASQPLVPQEFTGYQSQAGANATYKSSQPQADVSAQLPAPLAELPARDALLPKLASNKSREMSCPKFTPLSGERTLRLTITGGPRFDRKVFAGAPPIFEAYRANRLALENTRPGFELAMRAEVGRSSGPFAGAGIQYGHYNSRYAILGEPITTTRTEERRNDAGELIGVDTVRFVTHDTMLVQNQHRTFAFSATGGYRYSLGKVAMYVAADACYELLAESTGTTIGIDGEDMPYSSDRDNWVDARPGFSIGGRIGVDIDISQTLAGDPGRLALLLEASARNTGVFTGQDDPLNYRYSRIGASAGIRYNF